MILIIITLLYYPTDTTLITGGYSECWYFLKRYPTENKRMLFTLSDFNAKQMETKSFRCYFCKYIISPSLLTYPNLLPKLNSDMSLLKPLTLSN